MLLLLLCLPFQAMLLLFISISFLLEYVDRPGDCIFSYWCPTYLNNPMLSYGVAIHFVTIIIGIMKDAFKLRCLQIHYTAYVRIHTS